MIKYILLICFLFLSSGYAKSQFLLVLDENNLHPIENVMVTDEIHNHFALTNQKGKADLSQFPQSVTLHLSHPAYEKTNIKWDGKQKEVTVQLKENLIKISEIVISSNRWQQKRTDVSSKIVSIPAKEVAMQNPQTAADLVGSSNEVFIQKSQLGGGSPMIRGFSTNRVLIAVDGIRMNNAIFRSGNLQNIISIDPYTVQETEILFGPGSVIYGSDAIGGVMSFSTLQPLFSDSNQVFINGKSGVRYSSASNENTLHFDVNVGWQKWAFISSFSYNKFGDLRMGSHGPDDYLRHDYVERINGADVVVTNQDPLIQKPTSYNQANLMQKIGFKPNEHWDVTYGFLYSTTSDYSRYDRLNRYKNGLPRSSEWYYGPQEWMMNNLIVNHQQPNLVYDELTLRLAQQHFEESRIDRDFNLTELRKRFEEVEAYSMNLDFHKKLFGTHQFFYGLEGVYNKVKSTGTDTDIATGTTVVGPSRYPQSDWSSYAAYVTYQWEINEKLKFNVGGRYNQYSLDADFDTTFYPFPFTTANVNQGAFTGSAGIIVKPTNSTWISASFSTGFRSPNADDLGKVFDSEPGSVVVPNLDLKAEYAKNYEISVTQVFSDVVKAEATFFYTQLEDAMVRRDFQLNGLDSIVYNGEMSRVQAIQNASYASIYGIQAGIDIKLPLGFGLNSKINYQHGEEEMDDGTKSALRHAAPLFGATHLTFSVQKLKLDLYAVYNGKISYSDLSAEEQGKAYLYATDSDGNPYAPSWYTLNLKAVYQYNPTFSVSAGVENITDQRYRPYSSGITAPGRNIILSVNANF
ncbi:MAG TPA: TonB-dependent receptor [Marinilabiliales bacterium]|nr:TonB-dependent receptor [Marinilabiliales bacterium]